MSSTVVAVEVAGEAEHRLVAVVVEPRRNMNSPFRLDAPAGERARRFLDVVLGVVALAEREELHHLAREVLVRLRLAVGRVVEIDDIAGSFDTACSSVAEIAEGVAAQQHVLPVHEPGERTFCRLDAKWLCQNSVILSVSGDGVASISGTTRRAVRRRAR